MKGFDEEFALLKKVRAHLCVKQEKVIDKDSSLSQADRAYLKAIELGYKPTFAFATV